MCLALLAPALASAAGGAEPPALAGVLPLADELAARWPWSGAWTWPVGDPCALCRPGPAGDEPEWRLLRGYAPRHERHQGADLANGRARDPVRAAAHGLVLLVRERPDPGFGSVVVLGHRLREGGIAYSVYSHLARGSACVRAGECVTAGTVIAQVGRTGNATTDHLHFEVRVPSDPTARWERARPLDPLLFVRRRLPRFALDSAAAAPALDWADRAGLLPPGVAPDAPLTRGTWEAMLARAARVPVLEPPRGARALRAWLIEQGVLPEDERGAAAEAASRTALERDLERLAVLGTRLPPAPSGPAPRRGADGDAVRPGARPGPTVAEACLRLAGLATTHGLSALP